MRKARGYSGYYNGIYLRSALEFAYAYYLDHHNINWKYEIKLFKLNDSIYKPDFFIYDKDWNFLEIIEVKGSGFEEKGKRRLEEFSSKYPYPITLVTYKDILKLYQDGMPIRFHRAKRMWVEDYGASLGHTNISGENNPMYGRKQTLKTRKLISDKAKKRFGKGSPYLQTNTQKMIDFNRRNNFEHTRKQRVERVENTCLSCGKVFQTTEKSERPYCSHVCFRRSDYNRERMSLVAQKQIAKYEAKASDVRETILEWAIKNKATLLEVKFNAIHESLHGLYETLEEKYDIVDKRTISKTIFGKDTGQKKLVKYLQEYVTET